MMLPTFPDREPRTEPDDVWGIRGCPRCQERKANQPNRDPCFQSRVKRSVLRRMFSNDITKMAWLNQGLLARDVYELDYQPAIYEGIPPEETGS